MADSILSAVPINPYTPDKIKKAEDTAAKKEKNLNVNTKKYRENVVSSAGFLKEFERQLQRNKPIEKELAASAGALQGVEDPLARAQFLRSAENASKLRRQNVGSSIANALSAQIEGQRIALGADENSLNRSIAERDTARGAASTEYMNFVNAQRSAALDLQGYKDKLAIERSLGIGNFAPRGGGGGTKDPNLKVLQFGDKDLLIQDGSIVNETGTMQKPDLLSQLLGAYGVSSGTGQSQDQYMSYNDPTK